MRWIVALGILHRSSFVARKNSKTQGEKREALRRATLKERSKALVRTGCTPRVDVSPFADGLKTVELTSSPRRNFKENRGRVRDKSRQKDLGKSQD